VRTLAEADAALASWRERLAAASRNVVELSELPAYLALKAQPGTGRTLEASRALMATMDELWQSVLLIGAAIDRAAAARQSGSRLWRGEEAAAETFAILEGESIEIPMGDMPVLNRGLLASARAAVKVTPQRLLDVMVEAFEKAKTSIEALAAARATFEAKRAEIAAMLSDLAAAGWPGAPDIQTRLEAARAAMDPLGALEQIDALRAPLVAALQRRDAAVRELDAARADLEGIGAVRQRLDAALVSCRGATDLAVAAPDGAAMTELTAWLDRLTRTLQSGQLKGFQVGLSRWRDLAGSVRRDHETALAAASAALTRRDELRGRFGALRAKQVARGARLGTPDSEADDIARQLQALLFGSATPLRQAEHLMAQYEAALARPAVSSRTG
jgi:hypothetical protein